MKETLSFSAGDNWEAPSAVVAGKSCTVHFRCEKRSAMLMATVPCPPPTSTTLDLLSQGYASSSRCSGSLFREKNMPNLAARSGWSAKKSNMLFSVLLARLNPWSVLSTVPTKRRGYIVAGIYLPSRCSPPSSATSPLHQPAK